MTVPFGFWDVSMLLAVTAIILLITSEMLSPHYGKTNILISWKKLRNATIAASVVFLVTVATRIANILLAQ
jgi:hypothetical protein